MSHTNGRRTGAVVPLSMLVVSCSPHLPRIPGEWGYCLFSWVAFGKAVITPEHRPKRAPQGSPASLWEAVRKSHYSPLQVNAYRSLLRFTRAYTLIARPVLFIWSPFHKLASRRRTLSRCCMVFVPAIPYIQFSCTPKGTENAPFTKRMKKGYFTPCHVKNHGKSFRQSSHQQSATLKFVVA